MGGEPIELQPATKVKESIKDLPRLPEGVVYSVFPPASEHVFDDALWWNQAGQDIIDQRYIIEDYADPEKADELKEKLKEVFDEFPHYKQKVLDKAAEAGAAHVIRAMLEMGIKAGGKEERKRKDAEDLAEEDHGSDYEEETDDFYTPLHGAAVTANFDCLKLLVELGEMDVNQRDYKQATPLVYAARVASAEMVQYLLDHGADPLVEAAGAPNVLEQAFNSGDVDKVKIFENNVKLQEANIRLNDEHISNAAMSGKLEMIRYVLDKRGYPPFDMDNPDRNDFPGENLTRDQKRAVEYALVRSLGYNHYEATVLLFSYLSPRDPSDPSKFQYYPVIDNEACIAMFNETEEAAEKDLVDIISLVASYIFTTPPPHIPLSSLTSEQANLGKWKHRRLISAASYGALNVTKLLIEEHNAEVDHISHKYHATPLFGAAAQNHSKVVEYLLSRGADIHIGTGTYANGPTAVHNTIRNKNRVVLDILMTAGGPVEELEQETVDAIFEAKSFVVVAVDTFRAPVYIFSQEKFQEWEADENGGAQRKYSSMDWPVDDESKKWIGKLQIRKRDELLKETGESARPLMSKEDFSDVQVNTAKRRKIEGGELKRPDAAYDDWLIAVGLSPPRGAPARRRFSEDES